MPKINVNFELKGPVFTGVAEQVMEEMAREIGDTLGKQGVADLGYYMDRYFKNPTPYYETQVIAERVIEDIVTIHDRGIIYGPWLAGTGSRNATTRFKGYTHWREATQDLERKSQSIIDPIIQRHLGRIQ